MFVISAKLFRATSGLHVGPTDLVIEIVSEKSDTRARVDTCAVYGTPVCTDMG